MPTTESPQLLKEQAYERIKSHVLGARGTSGGLSERQLSAELGLSLGPVRAAVERLRAERLITVTRNAGIQLPHLTPDAILDFYEVRGVLEAHIVEGLASRDLTGRGAAVEAILAQQKACVERGEADAYYDLDMQFHIALASLYGNAEMVRVLGGLRDRLYQLSLRLHAGHPERLAENHAQHRGLFEAIRAGKPALARERLMAHLGGARAFILDPHQRFAGRSATTTTTTRRRP